MFSGGGIAPVDDGIFAIWALYATHNNGLVGCALCADDPFFGVGIGAIVDLDGVTGGEVFPGYV